MTTTTTGTRVTCAWRTGAYACRMSAGSGHRCAWHQHWLRLVEAGNIGRQQCDEFAEWWEQFQPWGQYAGNHGPWWAAIEALWPALTGLADPPVLTREFCNELLLRRAEVTRYLTGQPWGQDPWPRIAGLPLPGWHADEWHAKVEASAAQRGHANAEVA